MIIIQNIFCQSQRISPHNPQAFHSLCVLKKQSGVQTQPWLCKRETNRVSHVEPPTQDIKYQRFSRISTKHFGIVCHNSCSYTGKTDAVSYSREFEGALNGGMYLFGC